MNNLAQKLMNTRIHTLAADWRRFGFRKQIALALAFSAIVPSIIITQGLLSLSHRFAEKQFQQLDRQCFLALGFLQQEIDRKQNAMVEAARTTSTLVEANPDRVDAESLNKKLRGSGASFLFVTDDVGRTVAQQIRAIAEDTATYPNLPPKGNKATSVSYRDVEKSPGVELGTLPIVKHAIQFRRAFSGTELMNSSLLKGIGLDEQAQVGIRSQKTTGLPELLRPLPEGTYDVEQGKMGLVVMAVNPIVVEDRFAGMAIAGYLTNRNPELVDHVRLKTGIPTVTLFARDLRVTTNVPYTDNQTRAVGTRVSAEVAQKVLGKGQNFLGKTNIVGKNYRTAYRPLYDHAKALNPNKSQPIGIAYVGQNLDEFESYFRQLQIGGYLMGGIATILAIVGATWLSRSLTRPVKDIVQYAEAISMGELERELPGEYQAEMGELAGSLKRLSTSVKEANKLMAKDYYEQGFYLYDKKDFETAKIALQKAIALLPKDESEHIQEIKQLLLQISSASVLSQRDPTETNGNGEMNGSAELNGSSETLDF
jgi:methyl-accepting chemotaxis protein PixJ